MKTDKIVLELGTNYKGMNGISIRRGEKSVEVLISDERFDAVNGMLSVDRKYELCFKSEDKKEELTPKQKALARCLADCLTKDWEFVKKNYPKVAEAFTIWLINKFPSDSRPLPDVAWRGMLEFSYLHDEFLRKELLRVMGEKEEANKK